MAYAEVFNKEVVENEAMTIQNHSAEGYSRPIHWEIEDTLINSDGTIAGKYHHVNTVVDSCSKLIACLMKGQAGQSGIKYWAVGKGDGSWSNDAPPSPTTGDTKLLVETFRKAINPSDIVFLDSSNQPTDTITNKLQITVLFGESEANGELREFGLFGGNATGTANSGFMINRKIHPLIYKTSGMKLERIIRIVF